jgi:hypothetical protein
MSQNSKLGDFSSQLFFEYKPEKNAIYVSPTISPNYGYILPISSHSLTGNTYTFIYHQKRSCEMFIAPISQRRNFSKTFVSYEKYNRKLQKYMRLIRSERNMRYTASQPIIIKKTQSCSDLGSIQKMMQIFDITPDTESTSWPIQANEFKPVESSDNYFFGTSPDDFVDDFVFEE